MKWWAEEKTNEYLYENTTTNTCKLYLRANGRHKCQRVMATGNGNMSATHQQTYSRCCCLSSYELFNWSAKESIFFVCCRVFNRSGSAMTNGKTMVVNEKKTNQCADNCKVRASPGKHSITLHMLKKMGYRMWRKSRRCTNSNSREKYGMPESNKHIRTAQPTHTHRARSTTWIRFGWISWACVFFLQLYDNHYYTKFRSCGARNNCAPVSNIVTIFFGSHT